LIKHWWIQGQTGGKFNLTEEEDQGLYAKGTVSLQNYGLRGRESKEPHLAHTEGAGRRRGLIRRKEKKREWNLWADTTIDCTVSQVKDPGVFPGREGGSSKQRERPRKETDAGKKRMTCERFWKKTHEVEASIFTG